MTLIAFAIEAGAIVAVAATSGFTAFTQRWTHLNFGWLGLAIVAQLLAVTAYVVSYRALAGARGGPRLALPLAMRIVIAGLGPPP